MKFWEIFKFELSYQARRISTWSYFVVLTLFVLIWTGENYSFNAQNGDYFLNAPFIIAEVTAIGCLVWLLIAAFIAGDAAARDTETIMYPLTYTSSISKSDYLGGRFFAAFILNALILVAIPAGILLAVYFAQVGTEIRGPFRLTAYLTAYTFIALPNAFFTTAIQFSFATLSRRAITSYLGGLLLCVAAFVVTAGVDFLLGWKIAKLLDPIGVIAINNLTAGLTPIELNTNLVALDGSWLANRLLWFGITFTVLVFTKFRFHFNHHIATTWRSRIKRKRDIHFQIPSDRMSFENNTISVPEVTLTFDLATHVRQALALGWASFVHIAKSRSSLVLLTVVLMFAALTIPFEHMNILLTPKTYSVLRGLTNPDVPPAYVLMPLLIVFWSGRLYSQEQEAGMSEIVDATPVSEWALFSGKFLGLGFMLTLCATLRMIAGILTQISQGYYDLEIGLYLQILFGIQLVDYLLLALLALVIHVVVNQKHIGHAIVLLVFICIIAIRGNEIGHGLLVYGADPGWIYTDMIGFGSSFQPWLWFKLYWAGWALLLAVFAKLLWIRGEKPDFRLRLKVLRFRITRPTASTAVVAIGLILTLGGYIFYNTNFLNEYDTSYDKIERRAKYEQLYKHYEKAPQPLLVHTNLHVEMYPERREVEIRGTYHLVNNHKTPIDSVHLSTDTYRFFDVASRVETKEVDFDRSFKQVHEDEDLGHRIYNLEEPLQPGDSLKLNFEVYFKPHGFRNRGTDISVSTTSIYLTNQASLPFIGYQSYRELSSAANRQEHGLGPHPGRLSPYDFEASQDSLVAERSSFEAVVSTTGNQIAVTSGELLRTWTHGGRRYFHYATDAPIPNQFAFFSADYAVYKTQWKDPGTSEKVVEIEIFYHPKNSPNVKRMGQSVQASLDYYTKNFSAYPYNQIRIVEHPGHNRGMHAEATLIDYEEGFSLMNVNEGPKGVDLPYFVVAHEVAHQWWGAAQLTPAPANGAILLIESLASYSAYMVLEDRYGKEHLRRHLSVLRRSYEVPRNRATPPLLESNDSFHGYRKGPFAFYALSEYIGKEKVNNALSDLLKKHSSETSLLATTLDLYQELKKVTPDSMQYLLHDLFETNTFWDLEMEQVTTTHTANGDWQVTLDIKANKVVIDQKGVETPVPLNDWIEIGVFAPVEENEQLSEPLYLQMHHISSTEKTITVTVPSKPTRAGIDPYLLLIDLETGNNTKEIEIEN